MGFCLYGNFEEAKQGWARLAPNGVTRAVEKAAVSAGRAMASDLAGRRPGWRGRRGVLSALRSASSLAAPRAPGGAPVGRRVGLSWARRGLGGMLRPGLALVGLSGVRLSGAGRRRSRAHREPDALAAASTDLDHRDAYDIARLHHLVPILTNRSASWLTWTSPSRVHADIDEGAEGRHVGHGAFQHHAGLGSPMVSTPSAKVAVTKAGRGRVRAWRARPGCRAPWAGRSCHRQNPPDRPSAAAPSPISARRSRPQAATMRRATP